jgi:hypothetical protein
MTLEYASVPDRTIFAQVQFIFCILIPSLNKYVLCSAKINFAFSWNFMHCLIANVLRDHQIHVLLCTPDVDRSICECAIQISRNKMFKVCAFSSC